MKIVISEIWNTKAITYLYYESGQYKAIAVYMAAWSATIRKGEGSQKG
jgi:hypothetical protein